MTRASGPFRIDGLSAEGRAVLGWDALPDTALLGSRTLSALRTTAYPPDVTHALLHSTDRDMAWQATPVVAVERFGEPFLGARFAMVGFNGGEPRENAAGVYRLPWQHDPGLLTREWCGMAPLLCKLVEWCAPRSVAVRLELTPVRGEKAPGPVTACVRNLGVAPMRLVLRANCASSGEGMPSGVGEGLAPSPTGSVVDVAPGLTRFPLGLPSRGFGLHRHSLVAECDGAVAARHDLTEYVLPTDAPGFVGYGFSTYWAFPGGKVLNAFRTFCLEMQSRGCQYVRVNIPWEDVEPEPGRYDWTLPDEMMAFAGSSGLRLRFWMFPTTRGSGLGDAGVPLWALREPAMAADGCAGFFPSIWSPFYREHYFAMVRAFANRYATATEVDRLIIDFGNSDFPYGYFYYGGDNTIFDHSPQERDAFREFVRRQAGGDLQAAGTVLEQPMLRAWSDIRVPTPADRKAWRAYLEFRQWSVQQGIFEVESIVRAEAPAKLSPDLPGHGAGSIADLSSYGLDAKRRHAAEEPVAESVLGRLHNAGASWGGEAWQVAARYPEYDDALFQSLRLNADYYSLPGVDLGVYGDDVARVGFIRRTAMGAERDRPEVAIFDRLEWNAWQSLAQLGSRLDIEVDLLQSAHRHDFSRYRAVVLPPDPWGVPGTVTGGGGSCLVPRDAAWWKRLHDAAMEGANVLLFPGTVNAEGLPLREAFQLPTVSYGERRKRTVRWPAAFGGGESHGHSRSVGVAGEAVVADVDGEPVLVRQPAGQGALWFAGYDTQPDSLDGPLHCERDTDYTTHTIVRFLTGVGVRPGSVESGTCNAWKSVVRRGPHTFLLVFSHRPQAFRRPFVVRSEVPLSGAWDLATGERFVVTQDRPGWWRVELTVHPRQGRYLVMQCEAGRET
jgi:hypothetical protein